MLALRTAEEVECTATVVAVPAAVLVVAVVVVVVAALVSAVAVDTVVVVAAVVVEGAVAELVADDRWRFAAVDVVEFPQSNRSTH